MDAAAAIACARRAAQLSQRELARRAGTSGATIAAYELGRKVPRVDTFARIVEASGAVLHVDLDPPPAARDLAAIRSLAIHRAVADRVRRDGAAVRAGARERLARLREAHPDGWSDRWFEEWDRLLDAPTDDLVDALIDPTQEGVDRRQASPFAGLISNEERWAIIRSTREASDAP